MAGKIIRKDRYIWGIVTGLSYYVLLLLVSFWHREMGYDLCPCVDYFFMCLGGGALVGCCRKSLQKNALKIDDFMLY